MKTPIVLDVAGARRQQMDAHACGGSASGQGLALPDLVQQACPHDFIGNSARSHGMHLGQVGAIPQPPRIGQLVFLDSGVSVVKPEAGLRPPHQSLLQLDPVGTVRRDEHHQVSGAPALANRLRMQERRHDRLLDFPATKSHRPPLDVPRPAGLPLGNSCPCLLLALMLFGVRHRHQFPHSLGETFTFGIGEEYGGPDQGAYVPALGLAQSQSKRTQHTACPLETIQLRPFPVEHLGQVRVEGIAPEEPLLSIRALLSGLLVDVEHALECCLHVGPKRVLVLNGFRGEEPTTQHFGHVFLDHGLDGLFPLTLEDVVKLALQLPSEGVALRGIAGQQRGHNTAAVDLGRRLSQVLEEVDHAVAPLLVGSHLFAHVHQDFVDEDQDPQAFLDRQFQQFGQGILGGGGLAFVRGSPGIEHLQPLLTRKLPSQDAPRMNQTPRVALRIPHTHAGFDVQFIEAQPGHPSARRGLANGLPEFMHGGQIRQVLRFGDQVPQGDERVGLASAVRQLELAYRLVILARHPQHHVPHQLPQVVGREGQGEEVDRIFVDGTLAALHHHFVQVRRKHVQRQFAGLQVIPQRDDFVPALPWVLSHTMCPPAGALARPAVLLEISTAEHQPGSRLRRQRLRICGLSRQSGVSCRSIRQTASGVSRVPQKPPAPSGICRQRGRPKTRQTVSAKSGGDGSWYAGFSAPSGWEGGRENSSHSV